MFLKILHLAPDVVRLLRRQLSGKDECYKYIHVNLLWVVFTGEPIKRTTRYALWGSPAVGSRAPGPGSLPDGRTVR